jgi:menaquinol-cytochrome c reductase iron-sulfur subunit
MLKSAALAGTAGLVGSIPVVAYVVAPGTRKTPGTWLDFGALTDLAPNKVKMLPYQLVARDGWVMLPRKGVLWARTQADGTLTVFSPVCPHLGCQVNWQEQTGTFECPCHTASFDVSGKPLSGPPKSPLTVLEHKVEDGHLHVRLPA